jgi:ATP-dependent exoDNAse (exonuclease V) beta subunit
MELIVYKASAGSGKTFTLAVEYIKMLIADPKAYKQILAVTFTNKATAEMKERILSQLYGIHEGDEASQPYLNRLMELTGMSAERIREAAGEALGNLLHDYSRFRVETIDSFFQSVMRNLARELDLSPNLNIELNTKEVLSDAVDSMIEKLGPTSPVLAWLLEYIDERIGQEKRWNVANEVKGFSTNILNEYYIEKGADMRRALSSQPGLVKHYKDELNQLKVAALEQMKGFAEHFEEVLEGHGLTEDDLANKSKGISSYFRKLKNGQIDDGVRNATAEKCLNDTKNWVSKSHPRYGAVMAVVEAELMQVLQEAEQMRGRNSRIVNSCDLSTKHLYKLQLLTHIDEEMRTLNRENNRFLLSDTNALLHNLVRDGDSSFVFEKIGSNIRNVMIDEFQDTSRMQWGNFRLLLLEGLSQGADSLIVGDVKQSIYRWRNGDWQILNGLNDHLEHFPVRTETLTVNRRSDSNIINFNNNIFQAAVGSLNDTYRAELGYDCEPLLKAYSDVAQESPQKEQRGYVRIDFVEPDEELTYEQATLQRMGQEVERLLASGVRLNDIAILVRKNKNIPPIADYFDQELKLKVVSDEAFRLDASSAVGMLIDALRYLSSPDDTISLASLAMNYCMQIQGYTGDTDHLLSADLLRLLPQRFVREADRLRLMSLYDLLEELFVIFDMNRISGQEGYLFSFFDYVTNYMQSNSSELDKFIAYWDETLCSKTIPGSDVDGIRIFSIHKSKGLEFHTVLIPFCDWSIENETNNQLVWCAPQEKPFSELSLVPVNYSATMAQSVYLNDYRKERLQLWVDNLNLLYVAFTRARSNLLVWCRDGKRSTMSQLLADALPAAARGLGAAWSPDEPFEWGGVVASGGRRREESGNKLTMQPAACPVSMVSLRHNVEFRQSNRSADFIKGVSEEESAMRFINRGQLLHTLFSAIATPADVDGAISRLVFEGVIGADEVDEISSLTHEAISMPQVQDWYSGRWRLFNENTILYREDGTMQTRRPDRVMTDGERAIVVDFKFAQPSAAYVSQVQSYMELLRCMGYTSVEGYLWYVDRHKVERVPERLDLTTSCG